MDFIETSVKYFDAIYNKILIVLLEKKLNEITIFLNTIQKQKCFA